jgi:type I restriction enzyme S subunit
MMQSAIALGWTRARVGDVLNLKYGKGLPARNRVPGQVPVYSSAGRTGQHNTALTDGPVLVLARKGVGIGDVFLAPEPCWVIDTALYAPVPEGFNARYLLYVLRAAELGRLDKSSAIPGLSRADVDLVDVPLAPRREQDVIVATLERHLTTVDAGTARLEAARRRRGLYRRAVLQDALGDCVSSPAEAAASPQLPALPHGWVWSTVADEGEVQLGRMLNKERSAGPDMRPYLRVANVLDDRLDLSDIKQMDFPPDEYDRYRLEPGDILLNEGQSPELLGRPAMYRGEMPGVCFQKTLLRFKAGERVDADFALLLFLYYLYAGRFRRESRITTGIAHLTGVRFAAMEFPVPPLPVQRDIVIRVRAQLQAVDELDRTLAAAANNAKVVRRSLMNDALLGRLTRPDDSHATAERHNFRRAVLAGE